MFHPIHSTSDALTTRTSLPWGERDSVLIIEDNEGIAGLLTIMLGRSGLQVIWCQTGQEALEKYARNHESIAFVLTDCRLPDGDGREICRQMRQQRPDLPLVFSSGSAAFLNLGPLPSGQMVHFLPKPYSPKELLVLVGKLQAEVMSVAPAISAGFV